MKTILVIFTDSLVTDEVAIKTVKKYAYNTDYDISVGALIKTPTYSRLLQVVEVLEKHFNYVVADTGDLTVEKDNVKAYKLLTLQILPENIESSTIIGTIIK